jgi:hypothetical protein
MTILVGTASWTEKTLIAIRASSIHPKRSRLKPSYDRSRCGDKVSSFAHSGILESALAFACQTVRQTCSTSLGM